MKPTPFMINSERRSRRSHQTRLLYQLDERGHRALNDDGEQILDLDRAPIVLSDAGVPPALLQATFANSPFSERDAVRDWYVDIVNGCSFRYLALLFGAGSSHTAAAIARNDVKQGRSISWYDWHTFVERYTDSIEHSRVLGGGLAEEAAVAALEMDEARGEDFRLRYVYETLLIADVDLDDLRDFAVPEIVSMFRVRSDYMLTTVLTISTANSPDFERESRLLGKRGALLRLFESDGVRFDGR